MTARTHYAQIYVGVAMCSASAIAAQVAFTRIFSLTLWHHYALLVLSIALSGLGIAGAWLTARGGALRDDDGGLHVALARRARNGALLSLGSLMAIAIIRFNSLHLFSDPSVVVGLGMTIVAAAVPFVAVGVIVGTALTAKETLPNRVYAAGLLGASMGAFAIGTALDGLGAPLSLIAACLLLALASCLFAVGHSAVQLRRGGLVVLLLLASMWGYGDDDHWLTPAFTKGIYLVHNPILGTGKIDHRQWTSQGRIDVSSEYDGLPILAGDVALPTPHRMRFVSQDGGAPTALYRLPGQPADLGFLTRATTTAVWRILGARPHRGPPPGDGPEVLVIGLRGGVDALMALAHGASRVTGLDINQAMLGLHTGEFRDYTRLLLQPGLRMVRADGRSYLNGTDRKYDVIQLSGVDTSPVLASGAHSLAGAYAYTREAFDGYLDHLTPQGCLSISRLILDPPRETLRLAATARDALAARPGIAEPHGHIAILGGSAWATMVACASPIASEQMVRLRGFADQHGFALVFDPERPGDGAFDRLLTGDDASRESFMRDHPYRVRPVHDERPFFFDFFRPSQLLSATPGAHADHPHASGLPAGHGLVLAALMVTLLLALGGILWPLRRAGIAIGAAEWTEVRCYAGLGVGYLLVEVGLVQRLSFLLGHPSHGLTVVLASLLGASGIGAAVAGRLPQRQLVRWLPWIVCGMILLTSAASYLWLPQWLGLPLGTRFALALGLSVPLGFVLGMPFVIAIARLRDSAPALVPWAFGVNACFMVVANSAAPIVAMGTGFSGLLAIASIAYLIAFAGGGGLRGAS